MEMRPKLKKVLIIFWAYPRLWRGRAIRSFSRREAAARYRGSYYPLGKGKREHCILISHLIITQNLKPKEVIVFSIFKIDFSQT